MDLHGNSSKPSQVEIREEAAVSHCQVVVWLPSYCPSVNSFPTEGPERAPDCFWMYFPPSPHYFKGACFCCTARCLRLRTLLGTEWSATLWVWFPYKAGSARMLIFFHDKTDVCRKPGRGVLFCLKSESIFQISMDRNDFFILLEVNDIFKAVKCGLLAVLIKGKGNFFCSL